jgi:hypothetical protein
VDHPIPNLLMEEQIKEFIAVKNQY